MRWSLALVGCAAAAGPCEDALDWSLGPHVPYSSATLQRSITRIGDLQRLRPVLAKLGSPQAVVTVLVVGGSIEKGAGPPGTPCRGCAGRLWQDIFFAWLHSAFPARLRLFTHLLSGAALQIHWQRLPEVALQVKPDLVVVQTSLYDPLHGRTKAYRMNQTPVFPGEEVFIREVLQLPGAPAVIWLSLMSGKAALADWDYGTNQEPDSMLTEYYDVPQVSVRGAWYNHLPFRPEQIWTPDLLHPRLLGHKMIAVTLANFVCYEFLHACHASEEPPAELPEPLFYVPLKGNNHTPARGGTRPRRSSAGRTEGPSPSWRRGALARARARSASPAPWPRLWRWPRWASSTSLRSSRARASRGWRTRCLGSCLSSSGCASSRP